VWEMQRSLDAPEAFALLAVAGGEVVGDVLATRVPDPSMVLVSWCVAKPWRCRDCGKRLCQEAIWKAADAGFDWLEAGINDTNQASLRLAVSCSFERVDDRPIWRRASAPRPGGWGDAATLTSPPPYADGSDGVTSPGSSAVGRR